MRKFLLVLAFAMIPGLASATGFWFAVGGVILTGPQIGTAIYQPLDGATQRVFYSKNSCEDAINDFVTATVMRGTSQSNGLWPEGTDYTPSAAQFAKLAVTKTVSAACVQQ